MTGGGGVSDPDLRRQFRFEGVDIGPQGRNPVGRECLFDEFTLVFGEMRGREQDRSIEFPPQVDMNRPSVTIEHRDLVDPVPIHQLENRVRLGALGDRPGVAIWQDLERLFEFGACKQQASKVAVGDRAPKPFIVIDEQQDRATGAVHPLQARPNGIVVSNLNVVDGLHGGLGPLGDIDQ